MASSAAAVNDACLRCLIPWRLVLFLGLAAGLAPLRGQVITIPELPAVPQIDGDLREWRQAAFHDGPWDLWRVAQTPWYDPARNRLTDHGGGDSLPGDLTARYYLGWRGDRLYLGAEVWDNVIDTDDCQHAPKRWYYKDAVAWFFEIPRDSLAETFGEGDHGFVFLADSSYPAYGAWWRHGTADTSYLEEPLPARASRYRLGFPTTGPTYVIEAEVDLYRLAAYRPQVGDRLGLMIVHCDPDGGDYGGHLLLYGRDDNDATWGEARLGGPALPLLRRWW